MDLEYPPIGTFQPHIGVVIGVRELVDGGSGTVGVAVGATVTIGGRLVGIGLGGGVEVGSPLISEIELRRVLGNDRSHVEWCSDEWRWGGGRAATR